jgi:hypothetical protein
VFKLINILKHFFSQEDYKFKTRILPSIHETIKITMATFVGLIYMMVRKSSKTFLVIFSTCECEFIFGMQ